MHETYKNYSTYIGGFSNPEMARKIANEKKHDSSDEDFEESWKTVLKQEEVAEEKPLHRRRKVIK